MPNAIMQPTSTPIIRISPVVIVGTLSLAQEFQTGSQVRGCLPAAGDADYTFSCKSVLYGVSGPKATIALTVGSLLVDLLTHWCDYFGPPPRYPGLCVSK